jgi:RNA polymerase sigma-70 factor (ECF subfamily)
MKGSWDRERDPLVALGLAQPGLFEEFVRTEAATLIAFFQRLGGSRVEAEDLAQEVFFKLYRHATNYQPQGTFEAFAMRIARNAWIDRRRREAARVPARAFETLDAQPAGSREPTAPATEPDRRLVRRESRARLAQALTRLSVNHAIIFEMAVVQSMPYPEIARELDIPVGTVKSRVFHALRYLRAELSEPRAADASQLAAQTRAQAALESGIGDAPLGVIP